MGVPGRNGLRKHVHPDDVEVVRGRVLQAGVVVDVSPIAKPTSLGLPTVRARSARGARGARGRRLLCFASGGCL